MGYFQDRTFVGVVFQCSGCGMSVIGAAKNASFAHFHKAHSWKTDVDDTTMQCIYCKFEYDVEVSDGPSGKHATVPAHPEISVIITGHVTLSRSYS